MLRITWNIPIVQKCLLKDKEVDLFNTEKDLKEIETRLRRKDNALSQKEDDIIREEYDIVNVSQALKKGMTEEYIKQELNKEPIKRGVPKISDSPEVDELVSQTKSLIQQQQIAEASNMVRKIEKKYAAIKKEALKRKVGYDILELKTDLKLATLMS